MVEKILVTLISFILFTYIFFFKMFKKNDTNYIIILAIQAVGILINFIQIIFKVLNTTFWNTLIYLFGIVLPVLIFALEYKNINVSEIMHVCAYKIYMLLGNYKKAKETLINLATKYPQSYYAHKFLAQMYEKEGGMRKAIEEYVKTLEIKRDDYKSYYRISLLLKDLGRNKQAIQMLSNLLKVKPEHYEASKLLGELLIENEDYKKAITVINKALKANEDKEDLVYNLGIAYARTNEFSLAKKCFEKVINLNNNNYNAYYRLGQLSLLYRDFDMAENYFLNSTYQEKEAKSYYELTKIYMMKNQKDKAALAIQKAINADAKFYEIAKEEPILFPIKNFIKKPKVVSENKSIKESKKEKMIEEYLNDTYNLTKILNEQKDSKKSYEWNRKKK